MSKCARIWEAVLTRSLHHHAQGRRWNSSHSSTAQKKGSDLADLRSRSFVYDDYLTPQPSELLSCALQDYLPPAEPVYQGIPSAPQLLHLGYQHAYCRPHLSRQELCEDGTDTKFLPGPEDIWKYRLWAGGVVEYTVPFPIALNPSQRIILKEEAPETRVVEKDSKYSNIYVTIKRQFALANEPATGATTSGNQHNKGFNDDLVVLKETEHICFLDQTPKSFQETRIIRPPSKSAFHHTITPTRSLLFQFSALTYNAHTIHLDRELASSTYGAKNLVVHGPLLQVMMAQFLRHAIEEYYSHQSGVVFLERLDYKNIMPLYVDEPFTICCEPSNKSDDISHIKGVKSWRVWIQREDGSNLSLAVRGLGEVRIIPEL